MYYSLAEDKIKRIFEEEKIRLTDDFYHTLLVVMSEMYNYSEEDCKIFSQIIIGTKIESFFEAIPSKSSFCMFKDKFEGSKFLRYYKALAPFCKNGWFIYVNVKEDGMEYGIFRRYTEINGNNFEEYLHEQTDLFDLNPECKVMVIKAVNNFELCITRPNKQKEIISIKFYDEKTDTNEIFSQMSKDIISINPRKDKSIYAQSCMLKVLRNLPIKVHGTIMIVVSSSFDYPNKYLDGIRLTPDINLYELFLDKEMIESYSEAEKFYSITGAFYEMLNTDGITVITDQGRIIGYNAFYKGDIPRDIKGGARKRTAEGIYKNIEMERLTAVYFQSQDGEIFYKRREDI